MTREEFVKQRCEIDKITEEEFERTYRVVECNCGKIYCKGYRCLDLDDLLKENQELKKQLEERNIEYFKGAYDTHDKYYTQQKEFIKYLENKIKYFKDLEQFAIKTFNNKAVINLDLVKISMDEDRIVIENLEEILRKYKSIIGDVKKENNNV